MSRINLRESADEIEIDSEQSERGDANSRDSMQIVAFNLVVND